MSELKITELYAWICTDKYGDEGLLAFELKGMMMPMVGADRNRIESLRSPAIGIAKLQGLPLKLMRFYSAEILEIPEISEIPDAKH